MVIWKDFYATGVAEIDKQHRDLFSMVNKLESLIENEVGFGPEVDMLMGFLKAYTKSHFVYEEMCMRTRMCPAKAKNEKAHAYFLEFFNEFMNEYQYEGSSLTMLKRLHNILEDWLVSHIMKIDVHLRDCIYSQH